MIWQAATKRLAISLIIVGGLIPPVVHYVWTGASVTPTEVRSMAMAQQAIAVVAAFGIKPLYMLLSAVAIWLLSSSGPRTPETVALRWSVIFFLCGEIFCAANYLGFSENSYLLEYFHSYGMLLALASGAWAVLEFIDTRLLRFSDTEAGCHLAAVCRGCAKRDPSHTCAFATIMRLALPALMMLAAIPLAAPLRADAYSVTILGSSYTYVHDLSHQSYEIRFLPIAAMAFLAAAWFALRQGHPFPLTRLLFSGAIGATAFSWFRWVLFSAFHDNQLWFVVWEELTEMFFVAGILYLLGAFRVKTLKGRK